MSKNIVLLITSFVSSLRGMSSVRGILKGDSSVTLAVNRWIRCSGIGGSGGSRGDGLEFASI